MIPSLIQIQQMGINQWTIRKAKWVARLYPIWHKMIKNQYRNAVLAFFPSLIYWITVAKELQVRIKGLPPPPDINELESEIAEYLKINYQETSPRSIAVELGVLVSIVSCTQRKNKLVNSSERVIQILQSLTICFLFARTYDGNHLLMDLLLLLVNQKGKNGKQTL